MGWRLCAFPSKQGPRRWLWTVQEVPSFSPLPHPQWPGAALPAWIALPGILGPLSPWASCSWCCCVRALSLQSSGAGAELNLVIPLLRGSQDLKGSACSRSLLMDKRMCSRQDSSAWLWESFSPLHLETAHCSSFASDLARAVVLLTPGQRGGSWCFHKKGS